MSAVMIGCQVFLKIISKFFFEVVEQPLAMKLLYLCHSLRLKYAGFDICGFK